MENKEAKPNIYRAMREAAQLTREKASLYFVDPEISPERLVRIENEGYQPTPKEVLEMSQVYSCPELCNHYCTEECEIGKKYVRKIRVKDLSQIVLETIASVNSLQEKQNSLIAISVDGKIENSELPQFVEIQKSLEDLSDAVNSLKMWVDRTVSQGNFDLERYNELKNK